MITSKNTGVIDNNIYTSKSFDRSFNHLLQQEHDIQVKRNTLSPSMTLL